MKNKIKAALQQKYPQLGLADEVFEGGSLPPLKPLSRTRQTFPLS